VLTASDGVVKNRERETDRQIASQTAKPSRTEPIDHIFRFGPAFLARAG